MTGAIDKEQPRRRLSLLSLLLIMTCAAMGFGLWAAVGETFQATQRMIKAQDENWRLRREYGEFNVTDPTRLYAQELRLAWHDDETLRFRNWAWRVWVPENTRYTLCYAEGLIPRSGLPKPTKSQPLCSGFQSIHLRFDHCPDSPSSADSWETRLFGPHFRSTLPTKSPAWPELFDPRKGRAGVALPGETTGRYGEVQFDDDHSRPAGKRAVLQRLRFAPVDLNQLTGPNQSARDLVDESAPAPGFMIWIEPSPK